MSALAPRCGDRAPRGRHSGLRRGRRRWRPGGAQHAHRRDRGQRQDPARGPVPGQRNRALRPERCARDLRRAGERDRAQRGRPGLGPRARDRLRVGEAHGVRLAHREFLAAGPRAGERGLFYSFEESRPQILRNAASLSVLDRVSSGASFREFVVGLTSLIKEFELVAMCTNTTGVGGGTHGPGLSQVSTITDAIILLRYVELSSRVRRCMTIPKMRGSDHDKTIREYEIDSHGMQLGGPLNRVSGILSSRFSSESVED